MQHIRIRNEVAQALAGGAPVVALESTVISHGLPQPRNLEVAAAMEDAIRDQGAVPATIGVLDGAVVVGLSREAIGRLAAGGEVAKVNPRNVAAVVAGRRLGATTVAGTMWAAAQAGVGVMATGGIGGVHRGATDSFDISADITELARSPVTVVCSGAKAILDLPKTMEALETAAVPVIGYGTTRLPGFYSVDGGLDLDESVAGPQEAAAVIDTHRALGLSSGVLVTNPPPAAVALPRDEVEGLIDRALSEAGRQGVRGGAVTPFLLEFVARNSGGRSVEVNVALLVDNASVAASIATALAQAGSPGT